LLDFILFHSVCNILCTHVKKTGIPHEISTYVNVYIWKVSASPSLPFIIVVFVRSTGMTARQKLSGAASCRLKTIREENLPKYVRSMEACLSKAKKYDDP